MPGSDVGGDRGSGEYAYIVVGAGTAGSVMASRLSEEPGTSVLLLEAGPADRPEDFTTMPPHWGGRFDWAFTSTPQAGLGGVTVPIPRGRGLGGSSNINGLYHIRGHRSSYDAWAEPGAEGLNYDSLLPFFRRSEQTTATDPRWRGTDGPMVIEPPADPSQDEFRNAAWTAAAQAGYRRLVDGNGEESEGAAPTEMNVVNGVRQSVADAYLRSAMGRPNLTVASEAVVRRLVVEHGRCVGVEYEVDGQRVVARAGSEVVLCAGAVGSAHLLLLSGIGPADHLRQAGIEVVHDLPGVGENLQDHPFAHVGFPTSEPVAVTNPNDIHVLLRSSAGVNPDLQLVVVPYLLSLGTAEAEHEAWGRLWGGKSFQPTQLPGYSVVFASMSPSSRGTVRLADADPASEPLIDPGFYKDSRDLECMVDGLRVATEFGSSDAFAPWRPEGTPRTVGDLADPHAYLRRVTGSYFHLAGTCAMGTGQQAVVDPALQVHGLSGLRVVDASVMPSLPSANINASVLAIAERAASLLPA